MHHEILVDECGVRQPLVPRRRERGVLAVVVLTAIMMVVEIAVGYATGSMALLADGWHMATHVGALGLASAAYAVSRTYAAHRAFAFGTGKVRALAGYTSAVGLGAVAVAMIVESLERLVEPRTVDFARSLPVAIVGLLVNVASVALLHHHDDDADGHDHGEHDHGEHGHAEHDHAAHDHGEHDHNHRAALAHVVADAFTSVLAIGSLVLGRTMQWTWVDAISGAVGGIVILKWSVELARAATFELLDVEPSPRLEQGIRAALEGIDDVRVCDLHVWSLGGGAKGCVVTIVSATPRDVTFYRERLAPFKLAHLTVEVRACPGPHHDAAASVAE